MIAAEAALSNCGVETGQACKMRLLAAARCSLCEHDLLQDPKNHYAGTGIMTSITGQTQLVRNLNL